MRHFLFVLCFEANLDERRMEIIRQSFSGLMNNTHRLKATVQSRYLGSFRARLHLLLNFSLGGVRNLDDCILVASRLLSNEQETFLELICLVADVAFLKIAIKMVLEVICDGGNYILRFSRREISTSPKCFFPFSSFSASSSFPSRACDFASR